jgi:hypothetical protein
MIRLPEWAVMLPERPGKIPAVLVDPDLAYPAFLKEFNIDTPDQYWIEVCYQCIKLDLQVAFKGTGVLIVIRGKDAEAKMRWRLENHPEGKGVHRATYGKEARDHYKRIRGFIPG